MMIFYPYFRVIASWAQKLPRAIKIHQGLSSVRRASRGIKNPGGHHGGRGHQNMPTGSPLGPAMRVRKGTKGREGPHPEL